MAIVKHSERSLLGRQEILSHKKHYRNILLVLQGGKETAFWRGLRDYLQLLIKGANAKIESELTHDSADPVAEFANCRYNNGARQSADQIILAVENTDKELDRVNDDIARIEKEIAEINEEINNG